MSRRHNNYPTNAENSEPQARHIQVPGKERQIFRPQLPNALSQTLILQVQRLTVKVGRGLVHSHQSISGRTKTGDQVSFLHTILSPVWKVEILETECILAFLGDDRQKDSLFPLPGVTGTAAVIFTSVQGLLFQMKTHGLGPLASAPGVRIMACPMPHGASITLKQTSFTAPFTAQVDALMYP